MTTFPLNKLRPSSSFSRTELFTTVLSPTRKPPLGIVFKKILQILKFRWLQWGSSLTGLRTFDPLLCPPSTNTSRTFSPHLSWEEQNVE